MKNIINVFIASRHDEDCEHLINILSEQNDFCIAGVANDESGTIIKTANLQPDVVILDLPPPGMSGHEIAPIIRRRSPQTAIVMLSDRDEEDYAGLALKSGITGFLLKGKDMDKLVPVIRIVFYGGCYISTPITIRVFSAITIQHTFPEQITEYKISHQILSPAERGIITDIARGYSDREIASHLHFSAGTIRNYLTAIKRKTKLRNRVQIVVHSLVYGLINFDQLGFGVKAPWINDAQEEKGIERRPEKTDKPVNHEMRLSFS